MKRRYHIQLIAITSLITLILAILGLIKGWEIVAFAILATMFFYFSTLFIKYVDHQKRFPLSSETEIKEELDE